MDDFEAPSFSLGLDFDSQIPSFSIGLDDNGVAVSVPNQERSLHDSSKRVIAEEQTQQKSKAEYVNFQDFCNENEDDLPIPVFKRLRKGPSKISTSIPSLDKTLRDKTSGSVLEIHSDSEDIEEFSSDDDNNEENKQTPITPSLRWNRSTKLSLSGSTALTNNATITSTNTRPSTTNAINFQGTSVTNIAQNKQFAPFESPLESKKLFCDDDDAKVGTRVDGKNVSMCSESSKKRKTACSESGSFLIAGQGVDLTTPAFDEFCNEYFRSPKNPKSADADTDNARQSYSTENKEPPACLHFRSEDIRIRNLLRERLCFFLPISCLMQEEKQSSEPVYIDYLGQFGTRQNQICESGMNSHGQSLNPNIMQSNSTRSRKRKERKSDDRVTGSWTNVTNRVTEPKLPRHVGKRRVVAKGGGGTWMTDKFGRKIYTSKSGQKLAGSAAYIAYRKENGLTVQKRRKKSKNRSVKRGK